MDYRLHIPDILTIDFENAPENIRKYLESEFSFYFHPLNKIGPQGEGIIRFVDTLETSRLHFIGLEAAYDQNNFYLFDENGHKLSFEADSNFFKIICEKKIAIRFFRKTLNDFIRLYVGKNNALLLHASAFSYKDKGVVMAAWAHTGKTNILLTALKNGALYYSDDWVLIKDDKLLPFPKRLNLFTYNFKVFPQFKKKIPASSKILFVFLNFISRTISLFIRGDSAVSYGLREIKNLMDHRYHSFISAEELYGKGVVAQKPCSINNLFIIEKDNKAGNFSSLSSTESLAKITSILDFENRDFYNIFKIWQYAFPGKPSFWKELLEKRDELLKNLVEKYSIRAIPLPPVEKQNFEYLKNIVDEIIN